MSCNLNVPNTPISQKLREITGSNDTLFMSYMTEIMSEDGFTKDFADKLKAKLGVDINNIPDDKIDDVIKYVREYYNFNHPDINFTATIQNESTSVGRFGYSSIAAREFSKRISANFTLDFYHQIMHDDGTSIDKILEEEGYTSKKAFFADAVKARMEEILATRIANKTGISIDDVYDIMDEGDIARLEELLGENPVIQDANLLAVYKEMIADRETFFTEVFRDSRLGDIRIENSEEISEDTNYESIDEQIEDNEGEDVSDDQNDSVNDDKNNTIKELNEKLGDYNNFMTHVDMSVRSYLNSLKKLNSGHTIDGQYDYDTNNELGIPDTMNADECCSVLYSYGDFTNAETMIRSIREIAENVPGFAAFHQMADYLASNPDFKYEVYRTFSKIVVSKMETVMDNGVGVSRTSNRSADKLTSLRFEFLNSVKATSVLIDDLNSKAIFNDFNEKLKALEALQATMNDIEGDDTFDVADRLAVMDEIESHKSEIVSELARQLRRYYPTIEDTAIANYISNAKDGNMVENARNLAGVLRDTINASYFTQQAYNSRQAEIGRYYAKQKAIETRRIEGEKVNEDYTEQLADLYATSYIDKSTEAAAFRLANELVRFTMVKTELNSRNVHGNQSSDVINNSMITNVMNTLKSQIALGNFGKYKSQTRQYDFSNIMVEHRDENDKIINYGLFTHNPETNEFIPTEYAERLLRARLFSGASDIISSANVLYSEMSKGDYVATSFVNFFNVEESAKENSNNIDFANYFMRIPSDAPKNFIITAPKYSIGETRYGANDGLFKIENISEVNKTIQQRINALSTISDEEYLEKYSSLNPTKRTLKQLISNATANSIGNIAIGNLKQLNEDNVKIGDTVTMTFNYRTKDGIDNLYVMKGTLAKDNGRYILQAPEFLGFTSPAHSSDVNESLRNHFMKKMIKSKEIARTINTNHPVYKQFRNIFIQELNDAANALDKFFVNENGLIALDEEGHPIFREGFANDAETARSVYAIYHVGKGKTILEYGQDGRAKLTGSVFKSDRFQITHTDERGNVSVRNYGNEILEEMFSLLYGGANNTYLHTTRNAKGVTVNLTAEQEAKVTEKLSEFINDYIDDTEERIQQYRDFIPENLLIGDNVAEFALNHHLMYVGFNDLFEGDTKFYKDTQTFLKRAKESQGSGVPYGIVDYNLDVIADIAPIPSRLDETEFTKVNEDGTTETVKFGLRTKFKGITIKNTVSTSKEVAVKGVNGATENGAVTKNLIKALRESGMTAKEAEAKAASMMKGFHNTTVNDAQSYITFEEWVRRITARGQFQKYKPLIEAVLDESKPLDADTIGQFIQVQKNFYYDQYYNEKLGVIVPRQIKNAEFVLVPRLIRGTQLEKVYNMMRENDIDQLNTEETSKAGKCNVLTIWNNNGEITDKAIADFTANASSAVELYDYNHLYTQQETPQHVLAENKAGIQIMKKMLDNIDEKSPLYPIKQKFFSLYSANIKESFGDLMDELGLKVDENGNLLLDENGEFEGLNRNVFYDMLQEEVARLGLDSNMLDYVTISEDGTTNMPTYMSNVSTKLESIAQSLFNSRITRQKLPGFHAAQITNIGFKPMSEQVSNRTYSKELRYHPDQYKHKTSEKIISWREYEKLSDKEKKEYKNIGASPYIEVMLPASNFGLKRTKPDGTLKTDEELLKELQDADLDMMIGYRIPTEGKQSVCIMKVVGFTDDSLGSTIVVPDDWVSQTGSDFDIDSVYGINFRGRVNKRTGIIEKILYHEDATEQDYFSYIRHRLDSKTKRLAGTKITKEIEALKNEINAANEEHFEELMDVESKAYHNLPNDVREKIKELQKTSGKFETNLEKYTAQNEQVIEGLNNYLAENENLDDATKKAITEYVNLRAEINETINNADANYRNKLIEGIEKAKEARLAKIEKLAKEAGLPTFAEYAAMPATSRNSRDARNNEILQSMIDILSHPAALEENLSRSNFDDIIEARDKAVDPNIAKRRKARSPYNFFDQAEYQEDVMSGAKLKAFSVTRDTFCSICNTVRPTISSTQSVKIVYRAEDGYTLANLKKSFDNVEEISSGIFVVTHDTFGWSKDNKNVAGKILTAYSSQTTAHILDAVKEGAIPNVNDLTFQVYKLFPDLGSDYETGVSFIMQPGISRIVAAYNSNKSIYSRGSKNPVHTAIRSIAKELLALDGVEFNEKISIDSVLAALQKYNYELSTLFGASKSKYKISLEDAEAGKLLISASRLRNRLKEEGIFKGSSPVEERRRLLFDLGTILQYNKLSHLGNSISAYARVCNPDKFGAKQTIFATEKVFRDIKQILSDEVDNPVLGVHNKEKDEHKRFLEAIYPGLTSVSTVEDFIRSTDMNSAYPPLHHFLKYATATSIKINRQLFATQDPAFVGELLKLEQAFSGNKLHMTEKLYKDYQNYVLNYLYGQTDAVRNKVTFIPGQGFVFEGQCDTDAERRRIFGYGKNPDLRVPVMTTSEVTHNVILNSTEELFAEKGIEFAKATAYLQTLSNWLRVYMRHDSKEYSRLQSEISALQFKLKEETVSKETIDEILNYMPKIRGKNNKDTLNAYFAHGMKNGFEDSQKAAETVYNRAIQKKNSAVTTTEYKETENMVEFTVDDINNPTQLEINQFATLSPAQKVTWIQGHFREAGAFKYIRTTLFNERQYRRTKAGAQTIEFVEGNANIETVYSEFEKCFYNSNPLVALTALDVVKYAFAVEGFRMRRNAVNKMIKNNVLIGESSEGSTGIVNQLNSLIGNIATSAIDMDTLRNNFVRSHSSMNQISTQRVERKENKAYELQRIDDGIIFLNWTGNDSVKELAEKYGFIYSTGDKGNYGINQYVKLRFGKDTTLYKIRVEGETLVAYPLNLLEENESGVWSVNVQNNRFADESYYKAILDEWFNSTDETTLKQIIEKHQPTKAEHRFVNKNRASRASYATTFDINAKNTNNTGSFEDAIEQITKYFASNPKGKLYIRNRALANYITHTGADNGSIQTINGRKYLIQKADFSKYNKLYIGKGKESREVKEKDPQIQAIMERAKNNGPSGYNVNDAFAITPYIEATPVAEEIDETPNEVRHSTVTELGINSMNAMYRRQVSEGDVNAGKALKRLHDKDIVSKDASVKANIREIITTTAEYVQITTDKILNDLQYFIQDADGHFYSVNETETIDLIRNNPEERKRFLKTLLDARAFVRNYRIINELDIDSEDPAIRHNLNKIKTAINKLQNATIINNAEERFANEYLAKLSNNPLIQNDVLTLLDGYHSAGAFDAWVNDLQETSSPLLQIITKEVMGDIRAKEMQATQRIREFKAKVAEIKAKAKAAGVDIDWKHIIDENGRFIQDYNQAFVNEISRLRDEINKAKVEHGESSIEHLRAKFEYDKFKLNHVNQQLVDEYYQAKLKLEEHMLTSYPAAYSAYKKLEVKRREILSHAVNGVLDESYQDELKAVKKEMDDITNPYFFDPATGSFVEKYSIDDPNNPSTGERRLIYSIEAANAISAHLGAMKDLRKKYFAQDAKFGFDEELEKNLDIINNYEQRDANGRITTPMAELMKHDDYVKAKEWIEHNARYVIDESLQEMINNAFKTLREASEGRKVLGLIAKHKDLYDSHGIIDATKLTDEEIDRIRTEQLANYNIREGQPHSDRSLISNAPTDDTVFKASFYSAMASNGIPNQEYIKLVNQINDILAPYYDTATRTLHTSEITEEDLVALTELYDKIESINKTTNSTNGKAIRKYIKENVDFVIDYEKYEAQREFARQKGPRYLRLWQALNERIEEDENGNDRVVPNRRIYGYAVPKDYKQDGTGNNSMVDRKKTDALRTIHSYTTTTKTEYYYQKYKEMRAKSDDEFNAWYRANHIYNPYTHTYEPIQCWTRMEVNPVANDGQFTDGGMWVPAFNQLETRPKDGRKSGEEDYTNHDFKPSGSTASNYKKNGSTVSTFQDGKNYSNNNAMNDFEREMKELFESTLRANVHTTAANRFLDRGYMASRAKTPKRDAAFYAKETAKMIGWIEGASGREAWYEDIDYANDKTIDMPMMSILKSKDSVTVNRVPPERTENMTDAEYAEAMKKYEDDKKKAEEQNAKVHREILDDNWEAVMEDFITKAAHFNAVQDNKYMLFYAKNMLDKLDVYVKNEGFNDLQRDGIHSSEDQNRYITKKDTRLQEQYVNWIRRLVYDQWKKPNNILTRGANILQSLTSAKFMMLNITGGIANVTVGETQILGEAFAKEYFGLDTWAKGIGTWNAGVPSFFADMYSDKASSLASAIVKFMNVVDFDENTGVVHVPNAEEYMKRARDIMFSPQAVTEHMMQNGAMFSMMHSHRLVINHDKENNGKLSYTVMNEAEYIRDANERALQAILTDAQKQLWNKFVAHETSDANTTKEYAWFRKDLTTEFANLYLNYEQKNQFISKRRELQKQAKEEFNNDETHPTLFSQLKLGSDGKLDFKDDSILMQMGDEAYQLLGRFKGRVISVNKKIHGVYDRLGAAKWESYWFGGIVMQYHKHIYPGIMKRWRRQGYFNEERGTIEKGCYASIKDFLAIPLHKAKYAKKLKEENNMSDSELQAVQGVQNIIRNYVEFATHIRTNWNMIPESERANIKRALGDMAGVMSALCFAIGLQVLGGDDDEHNLVWNLAMYETDRLASESFMYNPIGAASEFKKLWSSPVAAQTGISDLLSAAGLISQYIIQGDDFDPYYQSGLYAGENKLEIKLKRNIPIYHGINMLERLTRSNKYYKLGDNMLTIVPVKDIADWIKD